MVFDKPSGLLVIATPKKEKNTLVNIVNHQFSSEDNTPKLYPCHRLDRDTTGAIIFAKGKRNQQAMMELFRQKKVKKTYLAFVHGRMDKKKGRIRKNIRHLEQRRYNTHKQSKPAITDFTVKRSEKDFCVVEVMPLTGRTNQIRIHFSQSGHPLVGERKYAIAKKYPLKFRRTALHAARLEWIDFNSNKKIKVQSQLPNDMEVFLARNAN